MTYLLLQLLLCAVFFTLTAVFIYLLQFLFQKQLTAATAYHFWMLPYCFLFLPFLPVKKSFSTAWLQKLTGGFSKNVTSAATLSSESTASSSGSLVSDFSLAASTPKEHSVLTLILCVWLLGILIALVLLLRKEFLCMRFQQRSSQVTDQSLLSLFEQCCTSMNYTKAVRLLESTDSSNNRFFAPFTCNLFQPCIILPKDMKELCSTKDISYMLCHEIQHLKHHDLVFRYFIHLAKIIYWFYPIIYLYEKQVTDSCEIACDTYVMENLSKDDYRCYGSALLNFAGASIGQSTFPLSTNFISSSSQLKKRITNIAKHKKIDVRTHLKNQLLFLLLCTIFFCQLPLFSVSAATCTSPASLPSNYKSIDLSTYFQGTDGSFVLYDTKNDCYTIYNDDLAVKRMSPDSTFKIYSGLFALEQGVITTDDTFQKWDGHNNPFASWNQDQDLHSAFYNSVNWYFNDLDEKTGLLELQKEFNHIGYGNCDLSGGLGTYWLESSLKISPLEQVLLLKDFYNNRFDYDAVNIATVKSALLLSDTNNCSFYGKTGTGNVDGNYVNGWFIGFIETSDNTYFFATNIQNGTACTGSAATDITLAILKDHILPGVPCP